MTPGWTITFTPEEFAQLHWNVPGPSGLLGGYQRLENWLIDHTSALGLSCTLDAAHFERLLRYLRRYGSGGPNERMRDACIPALNRAGLDVEVERHG